MNIEAYISDWHFKLNWTQEKLNFPVGSYQDPTIAIIIILKGTNLISFQQKNIRAKNRKKQEDEVNNI